MGQIGWMSSNNGGGWLAAAGGAGQAGAQEG